MKTLTVLLVTLAATTAHAAAQPLLTVEANDSGTAKYVLERVCEESEGGPVCEGRVRLVQKGKELARGVFDRDLCTQRISRDWGVYIFCSEENPEGHTSAQGLEAKAVSVGSGMKALLITLLDYSCVDGDPPKQYLLLAPNKNRMEPVALPEKLQGSLNWYDRVGVHQSADGSTHLVYRVQDDVGTVELKREQGRLVAVEAPIFKVPLQVHGRVGDVLTSCGVVPHIDEAPGFYEGTQWFVTDAQGQTWLAAPTRALAQEWTTRLAACTAAATPGAIEAVPAGS